MRNKIVNLAYAILLTLTTTLKRYNHWNILTVGTPDSPRIKY